MKKLPVKVAKYIIDAYARHAGIDVATAHISLKRASDALLQQMRNERGPRNWTLADYYAIEVLVENKILSDIGRRRAQEAYRIFLQSRIPPPQTQTQTQAKKKKRTAAQDLTDLATGDVGGEVEPEPEPEPEAEAEAEDKPGSESEVVEAEAEAEAQEEEDETRLTEEPLGLDMKTVMSMPNNRQQFIQYMSWVKSYRTGKQQDQLLLLVRALRHPDCTSHDDRAGRLMREMLQHHPNDVILRRARKIELALTHENPVDWFR